VALVAAVQAEQTQWLQVWVQTVSVAAVVAVECKTVCTDKAHAVETVSSSCDTHLLTCEHQFVDQAPLLLVVHRSLLRSMKRCRTPVQICRRSQFVQMALRLGCHRCLFLGRMLCSVCRLLCGKAQLSLCRTLIRLQVMMQRRFKTLPEMMLCHSPVCP
jgi:hypothetical protein